MLPEFSNRTLIPPQHLPSIANTRGHQLHRHPPLHLQPPESELGQQLLHGRRAGPPGAAEREEACDDPGAELD